MRARARRHAPGHVSACYAGDSPIPLGGDATALESLSGHTGERMLRGQSKVAALLNGELAFRVETSETSGQIIVLTDAERVQRLKKTSSASIIGTALEWYDFYLYGFASALVFGPLFFPGLGTFAGMVHPSRP